MSKKSGSIMVGAVEDGDFFTKRETSRLVCEDQ